LRGEGSGEAHLNATQDLFVLRAKVDAIIAKRGAKERKHIEGKLAELKVQWGSQAAGQAVGAGR
jgi:hypothetical protein